MVVGKRTPDPRIELIRIQEKERKKSEAEALRKKTEREQVRALQPTFSRLAG